MTLCSHLDTNISRKPGVAIFRAEASQLGAAHSDYVSLALELKHVQVFHICNNLTRQICDYEDFYRLAEINSPLLKKIRTSQLAIELQRTAPNSKINVQYRILI